MLFRSVVDATLTPIPTAYNYKLEISEEIVAEISDSSYIGTPNTYFIRFSDVATGDSTTRGASYMYSELDIIVEGDFVALNPMGNIQITSNVYLVAGAFNSSSNYSVISAVDAGLIKSQIGVATTKANEHFDINEYLGVDGADYATVVNFMGFLKSDQGYINLGDDDSTTTGVKATPVGINITVPASNPYVD